ncbi:MAG: hypothetical protein PHD43_03470 [Methylococcales bacterium]|nr:hypothetical protein [Methylococcales bacterium]
MVKEHVWPYKKIYDPDSEGGWGEESAPEHLRPCKKIDDPEALKTAYEARVRLACKDSTEKHWVAVRMIERAFDYRFWNFAPLLAAKLQTPDECPGLAGLDDKLKKILLLRVKKTP